MKESETKEADCIFTAESQHSLVILLTNRLNTFKKNIKTTQSGAESASPLLCKHNTHHRVSKPNVHKYTLQMAGFMLFVAFLPRKEIMRTVIPNQLIQC